MLKAKCMRCSVALYRRGLSTRAFWYRWGVLEPATHGYWGTTIVLGGVRVICRFSAVQGLVSVILVLFQGHLHFHEMSVTGFGKGIVTAWWDESNSLFWASYLLVGTGKGCFPALVAQILIRGRNGHILKICGHRTIRTAKGYVTVTRQCQMIRSSCRFCVFWPHPYNT